MSNILVSEDQINQYKYFVSAIRSDLGRNVILHIPGDKRMCPNCLLDPVNRKSTGMYSPKTPFLATTDYHGNAISGPVPFTGGICPVCNGTGSTSTEITKIVQCGIRSLKSEKKQYLMQGVMLFNDYRLNADIKYIKDFENARIIEVDGSPTEMTQINKGGLRDLVKIMVFTKLSQWPQGMKKDVSKY